MPAMKFTVILWNHAAKISEGGKQKDLFSMHFESYKRLKHNRAAGRVNAS